MSKMIDRIGTINKFESLILAQNERWRQAYPMQVERDLFDSLLLDNESSALVSNTWEHTFWWGTTVGNDC